MVAKDLLNSKEKMWDTAGNPVVSVKLVDGRVVVKCDHGKSHYVTNYALNDKVSFVTETAAKAIAKALSTVNFANIPPRNLIQVWQILGK